MAQGVGPEFITQYQKINKLTNKSASKVGLLHTNTCKLNDFSSAVLFVLVFFHIGKKPHF
jgi:hypothetical protein